MRNIEFWFVFCVFFIFIENLIFSQPEKTNFDKLSVRDGLSNSTIYAIYQDRKGFIWIGTDDGLNCYDGYKFTIYSHNYQNPYSISGDQVTSIAEDALGNLLIGVWDGGLNYYDRSTGRFHAYTFDSNVDSTISGNVVWKICTDRYGKIWVGTLNRGLNLFNARTGKFKGYFHNPADPNSISSDFITSIYDDSFGNLWVGTENDGLNLFNRRNNTFIAFKHQDNDPNSLVSNKVNTIFEDNVHNLWIGTREGISVLSPNRKTFTNYRAENKPNKLTNNNINSFCQDERNRIWIGTDGINFYDPKQKTFTSKQHDPLDPHSINSNALSVIFKAKDGIIWVGSFQGGLNIYDRKRYKFQPYNENIAKGNVVFNKNIQSIFEGPDGIIWIGTDRDGLCRYDPANNTFKYYVHNPLSDKSITGNTIKSIYEDSYGNLWIGTWANGLNLLAKGKEGFVHFKNDPADSTSLSNNDVWSIVEDSKRNLWIGTLSGGLNLLDRKTMKFKHFRNAGIATNSLVSDNVFTIIEDKKRGGLWIGTKVGLSYFDTRKMQFTNYRQDKNNPKGLSNDDIRVLYQDSRYNIWIGTKTGGVNLYRPENKSFSSYGIKEGLASNSIAGILEDEMRNIWLSTNRGISKFNPVDETCSNYTIDDGLLSNEFSLGVMCKRKGGDLIFGSVGGLNIIRAHDIETNGQVPAVAITKLLILNKEVEPGEKGSPLEKTISESKEIILKYSQSIITFEFTALNYTNSKKNQYAYKLEGFSPGGQGWEYIGNRRSVTFTNLDPKTYILRIKASNNDGVWNEEGTSLVIHVLPPFWKTWWFRIVFVFIVAGSFVGWYTYRLEKIKRRKTVLEKIVKQRTQELVAEKAKVEDQNNELIIKQKEILKQRDEIKDISERVHRSDEEKLNFFTNISHEIRTPLTLILGPLEKILKLATINKDGLNQLGIIYRNALNLKRLVNQILDYRKMDAGNYPLRASKQDIIQVLKHISVVFYDIASQNNIKFSIINHIESLEVWIDYEKFDKIMMNLLSNSFKFTSPGGTVKVVTSIAHIQNDGTTIGYVCIKVEDTGTGIPSNQLDKIFERFYQADNPLNIGGTGIGLTIVKSLVELHYGKIIVESKVGKGSCFTILLPLGNQHLKSSEIGPHDFQMGTSSFHPEESTLYSKQRLTEATKMDSNGLKPEKKIPSILIVEDNHDLRLYIKECLQANYKILEASNGIEGLKKAKKESPCIIISDIMMPEMDGLELCNKIKNDISTSHIPVILLTAKALPEHKLQGLQTGADDYISKPFEYDELFIRIKNLIKSRELLKEKFSKDLVLKPQDITLTSIDEKFLRRAIEVVGNNISDFDFDVSKFVSEMNMSRTVLHLKIKELTNLPAGDFIKSLRLKRAAQLLSQNKVRVSEISYMVGFSDPKYFSKCFRDQFGCSPTEFSSSHQEEFPE